MDGSGRCHLDRVREETWRRKLEFCAKELQIDEVRQELQAQMGKSFEA
jgi:hypothetical protein